MLTFITSNKFYRAGYGEGLRAFLTRELQLHRLIDFGDAPVFEAIAYASILEGSRAKSAVDAVQVYTWEKELPLDRISEAGATRGQRIEQNALTSDGWKLESPVVLRLINKLQARGIPLGEYVHGRFYYGIKTGLNEAFVVDRATRDRLVAEHPSAGGVLKPFLRGKDVKRWSVESEDRFLIKIESSANVEHPWKRKQNAEQIFKQKHPAIYRWLEPLRDKLIKRDDQGMYFWELRSCVYWEEFEKLKIIVPAITTGSEYALDDEGYFSNDKTSICIADNPRFVLAILNSAVGEWYIRKTAAEKQGGFLEFKPMYVSAIPIPAANPDEQDELTALVDRILVAKRDGNEAAVSALEREIDDHVYRLYGLTKDEIRIIEESTR